MPLNPFKRPLEYVRSLEGEKSSKTKIEVFVARKEYSDNTNMKN